MYIKAEEHKLKQMSIAVISEIYKLVYDMLENYTKQKLHWRINAGIEWDPKERQDPFNTAKIIGVVWLL